MKSPQKPFLPISRIWNISTGNIPQQFQENSSMSHMTCLMILTSIMSWRINNIIKSPQNHSCPFWSLSNFTLPNMSKCSETLWTCSNGLIIHLYQMSQVEENVILIKVPQNPLCPESNLNNFTLPTLSFCSQPLWACSKP